MITIDLPPETEQHFNDIAKKAGFTVESFARAAIIEYMEDLEDALIAEERMKDLREGKTQAIPLEAVMKDYGMDY
jgi:RHH-type rel operon transcriptional repressor/antitoxin RelB